MPPWFGGYPIRHDLSKCWSTCLNRMPGRGSSSRFGRHVRNRGSDVFNEVDQLHLFPDTGSIWPTPCTASSATRRSSGCGLNSKILAPC